MKMDMNDLLTKALEPDESAGAEINGQIIQEYRKVITMKQNESNRITKKFPKLTAAICALALLCSVTAYAAIKYFTPSEVAMEFEDKTLAKAFESDTAILVNETQTFADYTITLLGIVSGEDITDSVLYSDSSSFKLAEGRSYIVTAIEKTDGTPMPDTSDDAYGETAFFVSPYIQGENPALVNAFTMNGGYGEVVKDGIMYRILDCDNIEIFADRGVYLGVISSTFYDNNAYNWNEKDGTLSANADYDGVNALFVLPLDNKKADPEAAKKYLEAVLNPESDNEENASAENADTESPLESIDPTSDNFNDYYTLITDSVQNTTPDKENMINYEYEDVDGRSVNFSILFTELFPDNTPGISEIWHDSYSDTDHWMVIYELMEDGSVTVKTYQSK